MSVMPKQQTEAKVEHVGRESLTVTLRFEFMGMTKAGHPIFRDKLNSKLFVLVPYEGHP